MNGCKLCPRQCNTDRSRYKGFCKNGDKIKLARASLHFWEEPCISGKNGSGIVFFSGCSLKCVFCQNYIISHENFGKEISEKRLSEIFLELQEKNAHNINLVTGTPFIPQIIKALDLIKGKLSIPVVWNTSGYETVESLEMLKDYIDIFLTDLKYKSNKLSEKYSAAPDYFEYASAAIIKMIEQTKAPLFDNGTMIKGTIIRHLILPNARQDSLEILEWLSQNFSASDFLLSLMSQFTPVFKCFEHPEINRRVSTFEYNCVTKKAAELGFLGYVQDKKSASCEYTPNFDLTGI